MNIFVNGEKIAVPPEMKSATYPELCRMAGIPSALDPVMHVRTPNGQAFHLTQGGAMELQDGDIFEVIRQVDQIGYMQYLAKEGEMFESFWKHFNEVEGDPYHQPGVSIKEVARSAFHAALHPEEWQQVEAREDL